MMRGWVLVLAVFTSGYLCPAHALDCANASQSLDTLFCGTPALKKADEGMSAAYFGLLRKTTDPEFHEALIRSQRRWLHARSYAYGSIAHGNEQKDSVGAILLQITDDREKYLQRAEPIHVMEEERRVAFRDGGDSFAGYATDCSLEAQMDGRWVYECQTVLYRLRNNRLCSVETGGDEDQMTYLRSVTNLNDGKHKPVAICHIGFDWAEAQCPGENGKFKAAAHWNTNPVHDWVPVYSAEMKNFWKYDPDLTADEFDQPWMHDCLFNSVYPPPQLSHPDAAPKLPKVAAISCLQEVGKKQSDIYVNDCLAISASTHPPCNAENACKVIIDNNTWECSHWKNNAPELCKRYPAK
jgi:uncharacterized protein YecT (DUF1311 family)